MQNNAINKIYDELNGTGLFLESLVFTALDRSGKVKARREEPYSGHYVEGFDGTIDVLAISQPKTDLLVCFAIECKKADPRQKYWIFDVRSTNEEPTFPFDYYDVTKTDMNYTKNIFFPTLGYSGMASLDKAVQSFEFNETTGVISRETAQRPYLALKQANEAVSCFTDSGRRRVYEIANVPYNHANILFIPLVVTTANLKVLDFNPEKVDWLSGTIDVSQIKLQDKDWVHYEFPLSYNLRTRTKNDIGPVKRSNFIVNSFKFGLFVEGVLSDCKSYILDS